MNNYNYNNNNNYKKTSNNQSEKNNQKKDDVDKYVAVDDLIHYIKHFNELEKKEKKLENILTVEEINLPGKMGYNVGRCFKSKGKNTPDNECLNTNQLRKYFQQISSVKDLDLFEEQRNELYKVLPNIAYAVGRKVCPPKFYELMEACISNEVLKDKKDINTLIDFLTAVVAYSKLNSSK